MPAYTLIHVIGPCKRTMDSGFRFQTEQGFLHPTSLCDVSGVIAYAFFWILISNGLDSGFKLQRLSPIDECTDLRKQEAAVKTLNVKYPLS